MKLPDFREDARFNELRAKMSARYIEFSLLGKLLEGIEIDSLDNISFGIDGTLEYRGQKVLLYIKEQSSNHDSYKFHIASCATILGFVNNYKFDSKYVVTRRTDGKFIVNIKYGLGYLKTNVEVQLKVCKNCLKKLNYKDYNNKFYSQQNAIYKAFNIEEFFRKYDSKHLYIPNKNSNS